MGAFAARVGWVDSYTARRRHGRRVGAGDILAARARFDALSCIGCALVVWPQPGQKCTTGRRLRVAPAHRWSHRAATRSCLHGHELLFDLHVLLRRGRRRRRRSRRAISLKVRFTNRRIPIRGRYGIANGSHW